MNLSILYRGPLTSCNYGCRYCPFAKRHETEPQLLADQQSLVRFTTWLRCQADHQWQVLFTPWGEALVRSWYRAAIVELSQLSNIACVSAQTNLSCDLTWMRTCNRDRFTLWATYHPTETDRDRFLAKVRTLREWGVRLSVGMVGATEMLSEIETMRRFLPDDVYLWVNAQQPRPRPYTDDEMARLAAVDPLFTWTAVRKVSRDLPCRTGELAFTVDDAGEMRRCHFVDDVIGNIYDTNWEQALRPRSCPNRFCDCFLGQSQLHAETLTPFFGENLTARIPPARFSHQAILSTFSTPSDIACTDTDRSSDSTYHRSTFDPKDE